MDNERSLAKEITEGFEALKSMRNNEPVAWITKKGTREMNANELAEYIQEAMPEAATMLRQQQAEIEELKADMSLLLKEYYEYWKEKK